MVLSGAVLVTAIHNAAVSGESLNYVFDALGEKIRPSDVFVFFLAGHGKTINGRFYFVRRN